MVGGVTPCTRWRVLIPEMYVCIVLVDKFLLSNHAMNSVVCLCEIGSVSTSPCSVRHLSSILADVL